MKLRLLIFGILAVGGTTIFTVTPLTRAAAPVRIALPEYAVAHQSIVRLSDLLPDHSPAGLHALTSAIVLGDAPFPGVVRDFPRERIESAIAATPSLRNQFEIPPVVHVTRWARILSRDEVLHAIEGALRSSHIPEFAAFARANVEFASPILLANADSVPEATSIDLSAAPISIRARLCIPSEPRIPPFWVEVRPPQDPGSTNAAFTPVASSSRATNLDHKSTAARRAPSARASDPTLLVHSGKTVNLALCSPGMRITTNAAAMQSGRQGDEIRVRVLPSGRQVIAKVIAASSVEADFE